MQNQRRIEVREGSFVVDTFATEQDAHDAMYEVAEMTLGGAGAEEGITLTIWDGDERKAVYHAELKLDLWEEGS